MGDRGGLIPCPYFHRNSDLKRSLNKQFLSEIATQSSQGDQTVY